MEDLNGEETFYGKQLQYANQTCTWKSNQGKMWYNARN